MSFTVSPILTLGINLHVHVYTIVHTYKISYNECNHKGYMVHAFYFVIKSHKKILTLGINYNTSYKSFQLVIDHW